MKRSVWMNAWDLCGRDPDEVIDFLEDHGVNAASLGLSYHGGRMLLGCNPQRVVYEQAPSALYFAAALERFPAGLHPVVAPESTIAASFLQRAAARKFPVAAWLVLCHHDRLAAQTPECAIRNAFGEFYSHALCPANPRVQEYCVELCRQASLAGVASLDLEALSFIGYEHGGLHDKRGLPIKGGLDYLLSICCCEYCIRALPGIDAGIRDQVRQILHDPYTARRTPAMAGDDALSWRHDVQLRLLRCIRQAVGTTRLNVRIAQDPMFFGGKSTLLLEDLNGLAEEATFTCFGSTIDAMSRAVAAMPKCDGVQRNVGFIFHEPDCTSPAEVMARADVVARSGAEGAGFYSFSMAAQPHWTWLKNAIQEKLQ